MKSRSCVPKGLLKIARRFNAGNDTPTNRVPKGRLSAPIVQPSLRDSTFGRRYPALKRRAILTQSLRDGISALVLIFLLLGSIALTPSAQALIMVGRGNSPVEDPGWPEGALAVGNLPWRVGWFEGPPFGGGEWQFLYRGDNQAFAEALEKFAAIRAPALDVVVHDGPENNIFLKDDQNTNSDTRIDWSFDVWIPESWNRLYNSSNTFLAGQRQYRQPVDPPRLDVYIGGGGQLDWAKFTVPNNVRVRDERASAAGVDLSGGSMIRATITDIATGKPVAGAHLILDKLTYVAGTNGHWEKERLAEVTSDSAGLAQIERIQTNYICVSVTAEGYAPREVVRQNLHRTNLLKLSAELARAASIDGIVVDDAGKPVSGANVRPMVQLSSNGLGYDNGSNFEPFDKSMVTTDAEGRFEFRELPTGYVQFYAQAQGYYFTDSRTTFNVPSNQVVLHLRAAGDVSVAVTDKDGKPISKYEGNPVTVNLDPKDAVGVGAWSSMATVNEEGRCVFHNMPPGEYRVTSRPNPGRASPTYPSAQFVTVLPGKGTAITLIYK
jgi:Carboxypeptidase regulatory-like domain